VLCACSMSLWYFRIIACVCAINRTPVHWPPLTAVCSHLLQLEHVLCGSKEVGDLSLLRIHTKYRGSYSDESPIIQWFWVSSLTFSVHYVHRSGVCNCTHSDALEGDMN
jgi:hypothetical protein